MSFSWFCHEAVIVGHRKFYFYVVFLSQHSPHSRHTSPNCQGNFQVYQHLLTELWTQRKSLQCGAIPIWEKSQSPLIPRPTWEMSRLVTKPTKWHVRPAKTQITLGIFPVWSESSQSTWRNIGLLTTYWAHREDSDPTGQIPRLIWVFAGRTCHCVGFVLRRLKWLQMTGAYCYDPTFSDRQGWTNWTDPDQTAPRAYRSGLIRG